MPREFVIVKVFLEKKWLKIIPFLLIFLFIETIIFIYSIRSSDDLNEYFLPVGEGDSELIITPSGVKVLVDGGPDGFSVLENLEKIIPSYDRYIDVVILTHPEADHFMGLIRVLEKYKTGIFISNGRISDEYSYKALSEIISNNNISSISLSYGDTLKNGLVSVDILSPDEGRDETTNLNESAVVLDVEFGKNHTLFMSDVGVSVERRVVQEIYALKEVSVLKVAHHGSKNSSSQYFLENIRPRLAVIEVGKNNYGHPSPETMARLKENGARIFRTDEFGLLRVALDEKDSLEVFKMK